ncbi:DNA polymerase ligase N-terminal domain-containing protein [Clavibacter michiganensis]|uniref:DNA polymerase ligase N-terminal domain-containing protein n=1 Tax=Clavibacter michiganensis TaxID=28447 RepID=UPI00311EC358
MRRRADPLAPVEEGHRESLEPTRERLAGFERKEPADDADAADDRLATYRSKRDAAKTSEPVPAESPAPSEGSSFVIQEHHARALHWDFRLEHDGVLVSWALPKGVPTEHGTNHLAVQTEDHPLEYGSFEGTIPRASTAAARSPSGTRAPSSWRSGATARRSSRRCTAAATAPASTGRDGTRSSTRAATARPTRTG